MDISIVDIALQIAAKAHAGAVDRDSQPYILHPLTVGLMGHTDEERAAGFLHDVVEDTEWTFEGLLEAGIPSGVVSALRLLTHDKTEGYYDYVQRIIDSGNPIALQVKYHDLQHNYARGKAYPDLQKKHGPALEMVKAAIEKCSKVSLYRMPGVADGEEQSALETSVNVEQPAAGLSVAIFAGGCFWGVQHEMAKVAGVVRTLVGYTGGEEEWPDYDNVRAHRTHHVEAVLVEYDAKVVDYTDLCKVFFEMHDPAQTDGVGPDIGPQYRSCIFWVDDEQRRKALDVIDLLRGMGHEVNTLLEPASLFWVGEELHQRYYEKTGGEPYCHRRIKKF